MIRSITGQDHFIANTTRKQVPSQEQHNTALDTELERGKQQSYNYQIIRRVMLQQNAEIATSDTTQTNDLEINTDVDINNINYSEQIQQRQQQIMSVEIENKKSDPLVIDLNNDGITSTGLRTSVAFDLTGDGINEQISHVTGDDYFLVLDKNKNNHIDNGAEMFGDQNGARNGFDELLKYDDNHDNKIDAADAIYQELQLMQWNRNGEQNLHTLSDADINVIQLNYRQINAITPAGDSLTEKANVQKNDGGNAAVYDVWLNYR